MITEYQLRLLPQEAYNEESIKQYLVREKGFDMRTLQQVRVLRRSIDARQRTIYINLKVRVYINEYAQDEAYTSIDYPSVHDKPQIIVVGEGPGGLFAALRLIELGLRPIVIERGKDVRSRKLDLAKISKEQRVDAESNYSFGEGGAGAYSDGKLYTRSKKRGSVEKILNVFCQHGASTAILADAHPHIGTDKLPRVIENMRNTIVKCGGEVHFQTKMTSLLFETSLSGQRRVVGVEAICQADSSYVAQTCGNTVAQLTFRGPVILATGHSARDVYRYLATAHVDMEAKGIAVGVRLEHPSALIDQIQYHNKNGRGKYLPAAEYSFVTQVSGRGVYSFCMCPGGFIIPAATGPQQIVVNGMSPANRGTAWSNSGMVVEIHPGDIPAMELQEEESYAVLPPDTRKVLSVMAFQEALERNCWQQGNMSQKAPAQRMVDFVNGKLSYDLPKSSYSPGLISSPLHFWMPRPIVHRLQEGLKSFGKQAHGFLTNEATLLAVETRTSSPVRILRQNDTLEHICLHGLFPCGEGAGYAGGIVSAAIDGERCADMCAQYMSSLH